MQEVQTHRLSLQDDSDHNEMIPLPMPAKHRPLPWCCQHWGASRARTKS
jgi:hypothetical protein